jgi:sugar phosphate isomerase/epimerase
MSEHNVPRRSFLTTAAASMAGAALGIGRVGVAEGSSPIAASPVADRNAVSPVADPTGHVRLGVASYSLRNFPLDKALEMTKALKTPYINFKSMHMPYEKTPAELAQMRKDIEAQGFTIVGGGTIDFKDLPDEEIRKLFVYAKAAGMPTMVSTGVPSVMPRVEKFAKEFDIKVAIHNHGTEDKNFPSPYDVLKVVKNMDKRMGLCIDVGHTVRTGTDVAKAIVDAGPRLHDMHAKDLTDFTSRDSQVIVGEGKIPFPEIFRALEKIKYAGFVNLEYEIDAKDPLPGMKQSFAYMRGVLAGMATGKTAAKA